MKIKKGFAFHCHHRELLEYCYDYQNRVYHIKNYKPKHERKIRLKLFKIIDEKLLPKEVVKTWNAYHEARAACNKAWGANTATRIRNKAEEAYREAIENNMPAIIALHKKVCGCKEWNGTEIVFMPYKDKK